MIICKQQGLQLAHRIKCMLSLSHVHEECFQGDSKDKKGLVTGVREGFMSEKVVQRNLKRLCMAFSRQLVPQKLGPGEGTSVGGRARRMGRQWRWGSMALAHRLVAEHRS